MPKPMFQQASTTQNSLLNVNFNSGKTIVTNNDKQMLARKLKQPRSKRYMEAMRKLDAGGHVHNKNLVDDVIRQIREELPEVEIAGLLGYVSKCYLGDTYEVHTLDMTGAIINHYKIGEPLPNGMEKARAIAMSDNYEFIEVYMDCCRAIDSRGNVSVI